MLEPSKYTDILQEDDSTVMIVSNGPSMHVQNMSARNRCVQYCLSTSDETIIFLVKLYAQRHVNRDKRYVLVCQEQTHFEGVAVDKEETVFILSSAGAISVNHVRCAEKSMLVMGEMSVKCIATIAEIWGTALPEESGIYKLARKP